MVKAGNLPQPILLAKRKPRWRYGTVIEFLKVNDMFVNPNDYED
jgi:hypothetical protein